MTTVMHEASTDRPASAGITARIFVREFWGALAIVVMWLAVLFTAIYGGDLVSSTTTGFTKLPSVAFVALFAAIATWAVAKYAFGQRTQRD